MKNRNRAPTLLKFTFPDSDVQKWTISQLIQKVKETIFPKLGFLQALELVQLAKTKLNQQPGVLRDDIERLEQLERWLKKREGFQEGKPDDELITKTIQQSLVYQHLKELKSINPELANIIFKHKMKHTQDFVIEKDFETKKIKSKPIKKHSSSIPFSYLQQTIEEIRETLINKINDFSFTLPKEGQINEYLTYFYLYQSTLSFGLTIAEQKTLINKFKKARSCYQRMMPAEDLIAAIYLAHLTFAKAMCTEGDSLSLLIKLISFPGFESLAEANSSYALHRFELLCAMINYALNQPPENKMSTLAASYYLKATRYQRTYFANKTIFKEAERKAHAFFLYTQLRLAYHLFTISDTPLPQLVFDSPLKLLTAYHAYSPMNPSQFIHYKTCIEEAMKKPPEQRLKNLFPPLYGNFAPISCEEQKINFENVKKDSLTYLIRAQNNCIENVNRILLPLKESKNISALEEAIKKTIDWNTDHAADQLSNILTSFYIKYVKNDRVGLEEFKKSILEQDEKDDNNFFSKTTESKKSITLQKKVVAQRPLPKTQPSLTVLETVKKDEIFKAEAKKLAISGGESKLALEPALTKVKKKKKKKSTKLKQSISSSSSLSPVSYEAKTEISSLSSNFQSSLSVEHKRKLRLGETISPIYFFNDFLSIDSSAELISFIQQSPTMIFNDNYVGSVRLSGSTVLNGLIRVIHKNDYPSCPPEDIDLFFNDFQRGMGIFSHLKNYNFIYQASVKTLFSKYICDDFGLFNGKKIRCEFTIIPTGVMTINSIPLSRVSVVIDDKNQCHFIGLTDEIQQDILDKRFRVDIPSFDEKSFFYEKYFLTRFSKYYNKLVVQLNWTIEEKSKSILYVEEFLIPYLTKIKNHSLQAFQKEVGRLIEYHQQAAMDAKPLEKGALIKDVLSPMILAIFSVLLATKKDEVNFAPLLTKLFLESFRNNQLPTRSPELSLDLWLEAIIKTLDSKTESLIVPFEMIQKKCCDELKESSVSSSSLISKGMFGLRSTASATLDETILADEKRQVL